uniref:Uncharacterized protein n=1 Tax=Cyprinodon variegatus TaxID=28743 RepID=A0A3Q2C9T2_CYPVA
MQSNCDTWSDSHYLPLVASFFLQLPQRSRLCCFSFIYQNLKVFMQRSLQQRDDSNTCKNLQALSTSQYSPSASVLVLLVVRFTVSQVLVENKHQRGKTP